MWRRRLLLRWRGRRRRLRGMIELELLEVLRWSWDGFY
jgi:hypothetical protein